MIHTILSGPTVLLFRPIYFRLVMPLLFESLQNFSEEEMTSNMMSLTCKQLYQPGIVGLQAVMKGV